MRKLLIASAFMRAIDRPWWVKGVLTMREVKVYSKI